MSVQTPTQITCDAVQLTAYSHPEIYHDPRWKLLLRRGETRSQRRAARHGLLPLQLVPQLVRRTSERLQPVAARGRQGLAGRRAHRHLQQDRGQLPEIL